MIKIDSLIKLNSNYLKISLCFRQAPMLVSNFQSIIFMVIEFILKLIENFVHIIEYSKDFEVYKGTYSSKLIKLEAIR